MPTGSVFRYRRWLSPLFGVLAAWAAASNPGPAFGAESLLEALVSSSRGVRATAPTNRSYGTDTLKPEGLKSCLTLAHRIDTMGAELDTEKRAIAALNRDIDAEGLALQEDSAGKYFGEDKVAEFTRRVDRYNAHVAHRVERVEAYNRAIDEYTALLEDFEKGCNGRSYYDVDLMTLRPELPPEIQNVLK